MDDWDRYIAKREAQSPGFKERYERGFQDFRVGVLLRAAREEAGLTQEEVANRLNTRKSAISRIENHAGDIRLSTLRRYASAIGRQLTVELGPCTKAEAPRVRRARAS